MKKDGSGELFGFYVAVGFFKKQSETNTNPVSLVARQELRTLYAQAAN